MIIVLHAIISFIVVTLLSKYLVKKGSMLKLKRLLIALEAYILGSLIASILILIGSSFTWESIKIQYLDALTNFILHILLVPYAWILILYFVKKTESK